MAEQITRLDHYLANMLSDEILFKNACMHLPNPKLTLLHKILGNFIKDNNPEINVEQLTETLTKTDNNIIFAALSAIPLLDMLCISAMTDLIIKEMNNN